MTKFDVGRCHTIVEPPVWTFPYPCPGCGRWLWQGTCERKFTCLDCLEYDLFTSGTVFLDWGGNWK